MSGHGGTGRRVRLRGVWATIRVQVPVTAPKKRQPTGCLFFYCFRDFKLLRNLTATQFEPVFRCTLKLRFRCKASPGDRTKTSEQSYLLRFFLYKKSSPYRLLLLFRQNTVLTSYAFGFIIDCLFLLLP